MFIGSVQALLRSPTTADAALALWINFERFRIELIRPIRSLLALTTRPAGRVLGAQVQVTCPHTSRKFDKRTKSSGTIPQVTILLSLRSQHKLTGDHIITMRLWHSLRRQYRAFAAGFQPCGLGSQLQLCSFVQIAALPTPTQLFNIGCNYIDQ